ncbi:hypothetical protein OAP07_06085 [Bacteroidia bacterium]|nr:hypothetical protein [Bacteroidia bacterium]MDC0561623.1 hypothetical protein [Bacteroidia bacterium]MDC3406559.1 hypothetical protein [Bacteroidia bacterium]
MKKQDIIVLSSIILVLIAMRSIFNIPNFNPIGAIALMGGILFHKKTTAFLVTIGALFLGDIILGLSSPIYMDYMFSTTFLFVYVAFLLMIMLGTALKNRASLMTISLGSVVSAILFFLITNAGSWLALNYDRSLSGLMSAYNAGIPFFRATLVSQLLFSLGIYIIYNLATQRKTSLA